MERKIILIKEKSIEDFLFRYSPAGISTSAGMGERGTAHRNLKDEIHLKKECGIEPGTEVRFLVEDITSFSQMPVRVLFFYKACEYDDVSIVLEIVKKEILTD